VAFQFNCLILGKVISDSSFWDVMLHGWVSDSQCLEETLGTICEAVLCHIPEDHNPQLYHCESIKTGEVINVTEFHIFD
jgi:hypothetical protein